MDATAVRPGKGEHVVEVVGNADERLGTANGGGDGMEQEMRFGSRTDDVAVAVRPVAQHRTGDVGPVTVMVFGIVTARAEAVVSAFGC